MKSILKLLYLSIIISLIKTSNIFMSTTGNDETGDGTIENPYLSLMKCQEMANEGDTVYIKGGIYTNFEIADQTNTYNYIHKFTKNSITYKAYDPSDKVIFDFEFLEKYKVKDGIISQRVTGFFIPDGVENVILEDFSCTGLPTMSQEEINALGGKSLSQSECFQSRGKNIRFNRINAYGNHAIGFYFAGVNSYNIAYRCDAYNNSGVDSGSKGNADGFGAHGLGAEFIECRAWDNSDDNYDCISSYGSNLFDSCWSFKLNYTNSDIQDGNGFKVGGWGKSATAKEKYINIVVIILLFMLLKIVLLLQIKLMAFILIINLDKLLFGIIIELIIIKLILI